MSRGGVVRGSRPAPKRTIEGTVLRDVVADIIVSGAVLPLEVMHALMSDAFTTYKQVKTRIDELSTPDAPVADQQELRYLVPFLARARDTALSAAIAAAPYIHAKLANVEVTGKDGKDLIPPDIQVTFVKASGEHVTIDANPGSVRATIQ